MAKSLICCYKCKCFKRGIPHQSNKTRSSPRISDNRLEFGRSRCRTRNGSFSRKHRAGRLVAGWPFGGACHAADCRKRRHRSAAWQNLLRFGLSLILIREECLTAAEPNFSFTQFPYGMIAVKTVSRWQPHSCSNPKTPSRQIHLIEIDSRIK